MLNEENFPVPPDVVQFCEKGWACASILVIECYLPLLIFKLPNEPPKAYKYVFEKNHEVHIVSHRAKQYLEYTLTEVPKNDTANSEDES